MQTEIICYCSNVGKKEILAAVKDGAKTLQDIRNKTGACTLGRCMEFNPKKRCCSSDINEIINEALERQPFN